MGTDGRGSESWDGEVLVSSFGFGLDSDGLVGGDFVLK